MTRTGRVVQLMRLHHLHDELTSISTASLCDTRIHASAGVPIVDVIMGCAGR
jgi:hypothetical protein